MKQRIFLILALLAAALPAWSQTNVGVSVAVSQPGLYGRIDIGNVPQPPMLVFPQPVVIAPQPVAVVQQPIYLHVPPGHAKNWGKHCGKYNACGQPVYFVQENWYRTQYVPVMEQRRHHHDDDRDDDRGHGHGKGHGKGHKD